MPTAEPIPEGYRSAIPYLICKGAAAAIEFYQKAFGAQVVLRMDGPGGAVGHAELKIGEARFMMAEEYPDTRFLSPRSLGGTPVSVYVYVPDVDGFAKRAMDAGAKVLRPVETQFYGDRSVSLEDPFGHCWEFATHVEDVPPEELKRRSEAKFSVSTGGG